MTVWSKIFIENADSLNLCFAYSCFVFDFDQEEFVRRSTSAGCERPQSEGSDSDGEDTD